MKQQIELVRVELNEDFIVVESESTIFVHIGRATFPELEQISKLRKEVLKLCKEKGVKISYANKTAKKFKDGAIAYNAQRATYNNLYMLLLKMWKEKVAKGIFVGYCDDKDLEEISKFNREFVALDYRSTALSSVIMYNQQLYHYKEMIENSYGNLTKITL